MDTNIQNFSSTQTQQYLEKKISANYKMDQKGLNNVAKQANNISQKRIK